ncbi:MAG: hypothetical protein K6G29_07835, partial [Clostridiales bacterium]|nr:hypothetical protein [Clostridiales bacterium]
VLKEMLRCLCPTTIHIAVPEFLAVGRSFQAFLSGSVKGGGWYPFFLVLLIPSNSVIPSVPSADVIK